MSTSKQLQLFGKTLSALDLLRIAPLREASKLSSMSEDTLRRHHRDKIIKLSDRRDGMRVMHALMLGSEAIQP